MEFKAVGRLVRGAGQDILFKVLEFNAGANAMTDKQLVIDAVSRLPDATPMEAIREEVDVLAAIRRGEDSADAGRVVSHDEVKRLVASWS